MRNLTGEELATIRDAIGDEVRLPRERELTELSTPGVRFVTLHGEPGVGKTVVAKWWAEKQMNTARVWWLNAGALDVVSFTAFAGTFGLQNPLADLLASTPDALAWLVVDGLDASYDSRVFRHLAQLLHALPQCWRVLLTCQTEHWERIRDLLEKANAPADWVSIEVFTPAISEDVLAQLRIWNRFSGDRACAPFSRDQDIWIASHATSTLGISNMTGLVSQTCSTGFGEPKLKRHHMARHKAR